MVNCDGIINVAAHHCGLQSGDEVEAVEVMLLMLVSRQQMRGTEA